MKNDSFKNCGYGTLAEILLLQYAFDRLEIETVYTDANLKNERSQHILQKAGFIETGKDDLFRITDVTNPYGVFLITEKTNSM